jgi:hypothetical protein
VPYTLTSSVAFPMVAADEWLHRIGHYRVFDGSD